MKASLQYMTDVLGMKGAQFVIPVFQRVYSWTKRQCGQLWEDMIADSENGREHFMGTMIYMPDGARTDDAIERANVIDGQQRLTTIMLLLIALRDHLEKVEDEQALALAKAINENYLLACPEGDEAGASKASSNNCKLVLSEEDAPTLEDLVNGQKGPKEGESSKNLIDNLEFFRSMVDDDRIAPEKILDAIKSLAVVAVELGADDSPQQVFESLNSKGRPLSTADLLRNTLLARYGSEVQTDLFAKYWDPIDDAFLKFGSEEDIYLDAALHFWITKTTPGIYAAKRTDLYQTFKSYIANKEKGELEDMLASINSACLEFARNPTSQKAKVHLDWAIEKPKGMISQRKIFGD